MRCKFMEVEMTKKLLMLVIAAAFALAMVPGEAEAQHPILNVLFEVDWIDVDPYNIDAKITLKEADGTPVAGFVSLALTGNAGCTEWTRTLLNIPEEAATFTISWTELDFNWTFTDPITDDIDWESEEVTKGTSCFE